jgi:exopolysaccharide/PEP-CTERM locus tyrosine autokinase
MDGLYEQFRIAVHQVWRRRWLVMAVAWGVALLGWLVIALIPNSYEAKAKLFVQMQSILPTQVGITTDERQNQLLRLRQTLTSNDNLIRVVRRTDLNSLVTNPRDLNATASELRDRIQITALPDGMIEISATSNIASFSNAKNARTAAATVQGLIDLFIEHNLSGDRRETGQSLQFLDEELRRREIQLQEAEQRRVEFDQRFTGLLPGEGSIAQRMSAARQELSNIEQQVVSTQGSVNAMRGQLAATPQNLPPIAGESPSTASGQIAALEGQVNQNLARGWREQHPDIIALRQQIARLRPYASAERGASSSTMTNPSYVSLRAMLAEREAQLAAATARRNQLQSDLAQLASRQSSEPGLAAEQSRLTRDYEVLKQQYDQLLANREQVRLRSDVQTRTTPLSIQVVEPPAVPTVPASPNRPVFLTIVLIFAGVAGVAAAFVMGQLQTTFPTQGRLAAITGLPVLGTLSEVVTPAAGLARRRDRRARRQLGNPDRDRILAAQPGGMRTDMKHSRISILEKAAELYDFGAATRSPLPPLQPAVAEAPAPPARPAGSPAKAAAADAPVRPAAEARPAATPVVEAEPEIVDPVAPRAAPRAPQPAPGPIVAVDRGRLSRAGFIVPDAPVTGLAEEFRLIKRQLQAAIDRRISQPVEKRRSILVTSAQSGDGKSFCSVNLALSLAAEADLDVVLVDGDFAKPDALNQLGIESGPGLVDALSDPAVDPETLVVRTDVPGLSVLPAGRRATNVPELLASARTREILNRLATTNDRRMILFDSPPALMASPAAVMAAHVGQVLVVVRADRTTEADLRETISLLSGCDHVSLVLNGAALADSGRNFGGYEGYRHAE